MSSPLDRLPVGDDARHAPSSGYVIKAKRRLTSEMYVHLISDRCALIVLQ
jgi:hypothetical protein